MTTDMGRKREMNLTAHAHQRMVQRNVSLDDVQFILAWGSMTHCAGAKHIHLRETDVPHSLRKQDQLTRLIGVTLVCDKQTRTLITV